MRYPVGVKDEAARLRSVGIDLPAAVKRPFVHAECVRLARRLQASEQKVIGLVPASDQVAVPPATILLGSALVELTGATVAYVDANVRYPALSDIARGELTDRDDSVFTTRWLFGSLALLTPPHTESASQVVPQLARLLLDGADLFEYVLVDLTGFDLLGEHASASACMDSIIIVGQAHRTREGDLLAVRDTVPADRFLGVLLVG